MLIFFIPFGDLSVFRSVIWRYFDRLFSGIPFGDLVVIRSVIWR